MYKYILSILYPPMHNNEDVEISGIQVKKEQREIYWFGNSFYFWNCTVKPLAGLLFFNFEWLLNLSPFVISSLNNEMEIIYSEY